MSEIVIEIPEPWPLLNQWQRMHWRERRRTNERIAWLIRTSQGFRVAQWRKTPIQQCAIVAERYHGNGANHLPDFDNLYAGLKPMLDSLVPASKRHPHGLGLIQDDSPKHITSLAAHPYLKDAKGSRSVIRIIVPDGED